MRFQTSRAIRRRRPRAGLSVALLLGAAICTAQAATGQIRIPMKKVTPSGVAQDIGEVVVSDSSHGAVFTPALEGLPPGLHGFHLHEKPDCSAAPDKGEPAAAAAAGGHYDPDGSGRHDSPWGAGHRGDLPPLYVDTAGRAVQPVLAPRLKAKEVAGHALVVHAGGDNHSDHPLPLGGGAERLACGVAA